MLPTVTPNVGVCNPNMGAVPTYAIGVGRPKKDVVAKSVMQSIFIDEVTSLLLARFPNLKTESEQFAKLAKRSGLAPETIRRTMKAEVSPRLDTLEKIAAALSKSLPQLLSPHNDSGPPAPPDDIGQDELQSRRR